MKTMRDSIHAPSHKRSAGFQTCCIANVPPTRHDGGQVGAASKVSRGRRIWKSAIPQTWKSALLPVALLCIGLFVTHAADAYPWIDKTTGVYGVMLAHVEGPAVGRDKFSGFYSSPESRKLSGLMIRAILTDAAKPKAQPRPATR